MSNFRRICQKSGETCDGVSRLRNKPQLTILEYDDTFFLVENSIVSKQEMVDYVHRKSCPQFAILDSTTIEENSGWKIRQNTKKATHKTFRSLPFFSIQQLDDQPR